MYYGEKFNSITHLVGGVAYTVGVIFYVLDELGRLKHAHGI